MKYEWATAFHLDLTSKCWRLLKEGDWLGFGIESYGDSSTSCWRSGIWECRADNGENNSCAEHDDSVLELNRWLITINWITLLATVRVRVILQQWCIVTPWVCNTTCAFCTLKVCWCAGMWTVYKIFETSTGPSRPPDSRPNVQTPEKPHPDRGSGDYKIPRVLYGINVRWNVLYERMTLQRLMRMCVIITNMSKLW